MTYIPATCVKTFFVVITEDLCLTKDLKNNPIGNDKVNDNFKGKKGLFRLMQRAVAYRNSAVIVHL